MESSTRRSLWAGLVLIVLGLGLFWLRRFGGIGEAAVFFVIGGLFLAAYFYRRVYGLLVPACILIGFGAGLTGNELGFAWGRSIFMGLGCGFVAIFVIAFLYERCTHWWPLIPGAALILMAIPDAEQIFDYAVRNWPLVLVAVGVVILLGGLVKALTGRKSRPGS